MYEWDCSFLDKANNKYLGQVFIRLDPDKVEDARNKVKSLGIDPGGVMRTMASPADVRWVLDRFLNRLLSVKDLQDPQLAFLGMKKVSETKAPNWVTYHTIN